MKALGLVVWDKTIFKYNPVIIPVKFGEIPMDGFGGVDV